MNVVSRGVKNTLRSPLRSGAIVMMFAISTALILSILVARSSVLAKIDEVKATAGTSITIRPAGVMGTMGGGTPLTAQQLSSIKQTSHVSSVVTNLSDQLETADTSLSSALEFGGFMRSAQNTSNSGNRPARTPGISVTGTTNVDSITSNGSALAIKSGQTIDASGSADEALVGTTLATKNNLKIGDTFTAYSKTFTVKGIYETDNRFQDSGIVVPLATLQTATNQAGVVTSVFATVDSSDNVSTVVSQLKTSLGSSADITSEEQKAQQSVASLSSIASLALTGVIAAAIAGAVIVLLAMVLIVRERRREIGVLKAIGGTDGKVVGQFMAEGLTVTVLGAIIGIALGIVVSGPMTASLVSSQTSSSSSSRTNERHEAGFSGVEQLRRSATQVSASLTPQVVLVAIGATLFIALIGTAIPAWLTARIRPAEVLRTE